jgi:mono/diheme cytochrome c family protein
MGLRFPLSAAVLLACAGPFALQAADASKDAKDISFARQVAPLLSKYCTGCHGGTKPKAGVALDVYRDEAAAVRNAKVWQRVLAALRAGDMPPASKPKPSPADIELIGRWIEAAFRVDCGGKIDPGRITIRRLNRVEYNNTIRDLVGIDFHPADDFPADDVGYGFDNIGDVLSLPPLLLEKYVAAADKIVTAAFQKLELRRRIMIAEPTPDHKAEATRKILENFATHAYRRPVSGDELDRLGKFVALAESQGDTFEKGLQLAVQATLCSPHFLFRVELERKPKAGEDPQLISEYQLASRLSYFLWSSMPDEELFTQARQGALRKGDNLEGQVRRMLKDPRSRALVENFGGQWLQIRNLKTATPDPGRFASFDEPLRAAMLKETEQFFQAIIAEDRSILDFIDADHTYLNERLAKHYGIPDVKGDDFRRVPLTGGQRGGILTQASILTVTSNPTRTSPVKRGKWVLENILGDPPPPPPPDVPELNEKQDVVQSGSLRQRMEQHRANPSCAACHQRMDPLGFGFENYDAVGAWRTKDGTFAIDPSGTLPSGQSFQGPPELKAILKGRANDFARCLTEKLLTYALGRGLEPYDQCSVEQIAAAVARNQYKFSTLVTEIVKSEPFEKRRAKRGEK